MKNDDENPRSNLRYLVLKGHHQTIWNSLSLLYPPSFDYHILYERWQYYDKLIAHLEYEYETSLLEQILKLSKDIELNRNSDAIISKVLSENTILKLNSEPMEFLKYLKAESQMEHDEFIETKPQVKHDEFVY